MPKILLPNDLDADTIVPQFTDNQYVTEPVFRLLTAEGLDFNSPKIQNLRREYVRAELIRALIYSSQVVINRSAFRNNRLLSELFDADADTHQQFANLMRPRPDLGSVVLVEQERHASGLRHLELPRGFAEPGLSGRVNALKELREETGFAASECSQLGRTFTDTGISAAQVSFYHAKITNRAAPAPEKAEIIERCVCLSKEELKAAIAAGEITDSFTLQALALSELGQS